MTTDPTEILSAFVDGEEADASALAEALASPGAREMLIDFVRLRVELARETDAPAPSVREAVERELRLAATPRWRFVVAGAAAVLVVVLVAGLVSHARRAPAPAIEPPPAQREVRFTEGVDWFR
jgi:anti-sigma-K factor RskA